MKTSSVLLNNLEKIYISKIHTKDIPSTKSSNIWLSIIQIGNKLQNQK